ncbi:unnamed protein product [Pseudo-nitzschia multistriata]|uniref:Uncharacterized protein n=1 Tax=Pseudo-nitzschia multistriata TaxID=183589 RepID=A0A448Z092_9STRA|nr:unnamed protein product [Pseudo-nitzschia multistriata]
MTIMKSIDRLNSCASESESDNCTCSTSDLKHVSDCSPRDPQRSSEKRRAQHHSSTSSRPLLLAAAVVILCLSSSPSQHVVFGSSKHVPSARRFLGIPSSYRRPLGDKANNNNDNRGSISQKKHQHRNQNQRPRALASVAHSRSSSTLLRFSSASPEDESSGHDKENNKPPASSFNGTSLSSPSSSATAYDEVDDETSVTTTSFFRFPSDTPEEQQQPPLDLVEAGSQSNAQSSILGRRYFGSARSPKGLVQRKHALQTTFVCSLMGLAGFVEGFCIRRHGCFPNLMTGTVLKLAEAISTLNLSAAAMHAAMVVAYASGGSIFALWKASGKNASSIDNESETVAKHRQKRSSIEGVSVLSTLCFLFSDIWGGRLRLPFLAAAFGILNAGTMDAGAGVTNAITGHVTKIGQGFATNRPSEQQAAKNAAPPAHVTSARGLAVFFVAAVASNGLCALLDATSRMEGGSALGLVGAVVNRLPLGTTLAVVYGVFFRWYLRASGALVDAEVATKEA